MTKSSQTLLWVAGGAAVLYFLSKNKTAASSASAGGNYCSVGQSGACPSTLAQNIGCDVSSLLSQFGA